MKIESVFITGASRGIGEALASALLDQGASVYGLSRNESEKLREKSNWRFQSADLAELDDIPSHLEQLLGGVDKLDLVIFNAGVLGEIKAVEEWTPSELSEVLEINVWANKVLLDWLLARKVQLGLVIGISTGAAVKGSDGLAAYAISKSALITMLQVYANEHQETHFISLAPGQVRTAMTGSLHEQPGSDRFSTTQRIKDNFEHGRMTEPQEAAANILAAIPKLLQMPNGSMQDIREIG